MARFVVIGGANLDIKARAGSAAKLGTSNPGRVTMAPGGVARNVAENLAALGAAVSLISALGSDDAGERVWAATQRAGVDLSMMLRTEQPTGSYCAVLDGAGELLIAVAEMAAMEALTPDWLERHRTALAEASLIVADCNLPPATLEWLMQYGEKLVIEPVSVAKAARLSGIVDRGRALLAATPNRDEGLALTGEHDPERAAMQLLGRGLRHVTINLGAEGVVAASANGAVARYPSLAGAAAIADVTGAGDAAVAGLVFGLGEGCSFCEAVRMGQTAAAMRLENRPLTPAAVRCRAGQAMAVSA